jgi:hypothetical protein
LQDVQSAPAPPIGYSREFVSAGIETMRETLEWHAALKNAIERGYPLSDEWLGHFRRQIESGLKHLEAAANTDMDMSVLTDKYLRIAASRDYLSPDSLTRDPLEQKLLTWLAVARVNGVVESFCGRRVRASRNWEHLGEQAFSSKDFRRPKNSTHIIHPIDV